MNQPKVLESTTKKEQTQTKQFGYFLAALVLAGVIGVILMFSLTQQKLTQIKNLKTDIAAAQDSQQNNQQLEEVVAQKQADLALLQNALPNQSTIVDFLQAAETLVKQYDANGIVKFSALTPAKVENQLSIPLIIAFNTTPAELIGFLRQIERLPYILEITSIDSSMPQGIGGSAKVTIGARVYVQDPFNQP